MKKARKLEMEYFESKQVYVRRPVQEALSKTGKRPIAVRWVDVNKGDDMDPNYRSRLVAKDFRRKGDPSIFAPIPPLEALRTILMMATTPLLWAPKWVCMEGPHRMQISLVDISRAYFHARVDNEHPIYVQLPPEDPEYDPNMCGRLQVHMYGTRPAADGWHSEYASTMEELKFRIGVSNACVFSSEVRHLASSVRRGCYCVVS